MEHKRKSQHRESGQATMEFVLAFSALLLPVTMMIIFTAQLLWVWHTMVDFAREGSRYASTHCWQSGDNVRSWMRQNVPLTFDRDQFAQGPADFAVTYYSKDPDSGQLAEFTCNSGDCSVACVPEVVKVAITGYEFRSFFGYLGLPPVSMPDFQTTVPMESAGCDPDTGECLP